MSGEIVMRRLIAGLAFLILMLYVCDDLQAAAAKGGGGGKGRRAKRDKDGDGKKDGEMDWSPSLREALTEAQQEQLPVMVLIRRAGEEDLKLAAKLASWPQLAELSDKGLCAVKLFAEVGEGAKLIKRLNLKTLPAIAWLDKYGNPVLGMPVPDSVQPIAGVVGSWPSQLANIERFFKDHQGRAEKYLARGKLREAYLEFSLGAPFKGPEAEKAKAGKKHVADLWKKMAESVAALPAESRGRNAIVSGLRHDTLGTDFAEEIEHAMARSVAAPGADVAAAPAGDPATAPVPKPVDAAASKPVIPNTEEKSLAEVVSASASLGSSIERSGAEEGMLDYKFLASRPAEPYRQVEKLLQDGMLDYKKATADGTDRGPARNELLKAAHQKFDKSMSVLDGVLGGKPDAQAEKLMVKTSMLMYGCLKYQSL